MASVDGVGPVDVELVESVLRNGFIVLESIELLQVHSLHLILPNFFE